MAETRIPTLDSDRGLDSDTVTRACRDTGCFIVQVPRSSREVTESALDRMNAFFSLADDDPVKRAAHRDRSGGANGWTPMLEEPAYEAGTIAWVESFDCVLPRAAIERLPGDLKKTIPPTNWPKIPGFRDAARAQWEDLIALALQVYPLVSQMLQQDSSFLSQHAASQALNTMRLLNYPPRPAGEDEISKGISAHTDFECITLIHQDAPGLQIQTPAGEWLQVPVAPGQWTVLLGDMVERWSNGYFRATPHRVPVTAWPRRSIVMFMAVDAGVEVSPLGAFVDENAPPRYAPMTQEASIDSAMTRAEANRQAMLGEVEKIRSRISPG